MLDNEKRAQFVRGVLRRTKSDVPPEWAPGMGVRVFAILAVYLHAVAASWAFFVMRILLRGEGSTIEVAFFCTPLVYVLAILFGHFGRRVLSHGFPFARLVWFVSFGLLAYCFGEYAFIPEIASPAVFFVLALVFFAVGFSPALVVLCISRAQQKRGYDDSVRYRRSKAVLLWEMVLMAMGVYSGVSWFPLFMS